jgi:hypothetical protein
MEELFFILLGVGLLLLSLIKSRTAYIAVCILLFILSAYRGLDVGTDISNYKDHFERIQSEGLLFYKEPLWILLLWVVDFLGGDFRVVLIVSSAIILFPVFWGIYKESNNPFLSLFFFYSLYFYFYSFNIIMQSIALSLVFWGIIMLMREHKKYFLLLVLIAGLFQYTAFLAIVLLFIKYIPINKVLYISTVSVAFIIGIFLPTPIRDIGVTLFSYTEHASAEIGTFWGNAAYMLILNAFFFAIMQAIREYGFMFNMFFVSVVMSNLLARVPYGDRVVMYFSIIQILFFSYLLFNHKIKQKTIAASIVILFALIMFFRKFGAGEIFPYTNILF